MNKLNGDMEGAALISPCGHYRFWLTRTWDKTTPPAVFIMLNPSTADASVIDPTLGRCISFAQSWGCGGVILLNLYAYRSHLPTMLKLAEDPVGLGNDDHIVSRIREGKVVVVAWGGSLPDKGERATAVVDRLVRNGIKLHCLGYTSSGQPRHPLMLRKDVRLEEYNHTYPEGHDGPTPAGQHRQPAAGSRRKAIPRRPVPAAAAVPADSAQGPVPLGDDGPVAG